MSFIDELSVNFDEHLTAIQLPESAKDWGWPDVVYATPYTMDDRKAVQKFIANDQSEAYIRIVCKKLCNEDGKRMFQDSDKYALAKKTPAWLLAFVGDAILASESTYKAEEKND